MNNNLVENYENIDKEVRRRITRDMVDVIGLDNVIYGTIHAMVCECIDKDIPNEMRREIIINRINKYIDKWVC